MIKNIHSKVGSLLLYLIFVCVSHLSFGGSQQHPTKPQHGNGMMFTPNKGQLVDADKKARPDILFKGTGKGTDVYIRKNGVSYVESNIGAVMNEINEEVDDNQKKGGTYVPKQQAVQEKMRDPSVKIKVHRIDLDFVGASPQSEIRMDDQVEGYNNYYLWNCPTGITQVYSYNELTVENMYDKIDVTYRGDKEMGLKYTIMVHPGGDASQIRMRSSGSDNIQVVNHSLMIVTSLGVMTEMLPEVYQIINHRKVLVDTKYKLEKTEDNAVEISYEFSNYNPNYILVIDPWVTYYGGSSDEFGISITHDAEGNIAYTGYSTSINFPHSAGAFQTNFSSIYNMAFVVKMNANGNRIFGTYLGGSRDNCGNSIACDAEKNIYVVGTTTSNNFPVGASMGNVVHQNIIGADRYDAFLAKFDALGNRLWITFYGGGDGDYGTGVCVDTASNSAILYGFTASHSSISTLGVFQPTILGGQNAYVAKFAGNGNLQWGSYLGGSGIVGETSANVCCDRTGNIFICGTTTSNDFPVVAGHQMINNGGNDAYICKLNSNGTNLLWSSYYGGESGDIGLSIATDGDDNVILGGRTFSSNSISTPGSFQSSISVNFDGFLIKFNSNGVRQWGTYFGGSKIDQGVGGIACDVNNNIVTGGDTYSTDFPVTNCAYQKDFIGTEDQFIATFRPDGTLLCSGLMGLGNENSPNNETYQTQCITVYGCYVYLYAYTNCNYPVTADAFQNICGGGNWELAVAKLYYKTCGGFSSSMDFSTISDSCNGTPKIFTSTFGDCDASGVSYMWSFEGGIPASANVANPTITYAELGSYDVMLIVNQSCGADTLLKRDYIQVVECHPTLLDPPNVFTPNGDGFNDTYVVKYSGEFEKYLIRIFNRWGVKMYESINIDAGWKCNNCSVGTYFYIIEALGKDRKTYDLHGTITLLR